jgi:3-carboxy-cis,cis-muconate cycloisomerase
LTTFDAIFVPAAVARAVSDDAWLEAMLDVERALAAAEAQAGVITSATAAAIAEACRADLYDTAALVEEGRRPGNPAEPLVRALRDRVGGEAARWVHFGATSQDVVDTAAMLVSKRVLALIDEDFVRVEELCAGLARAYRDTPMAARTLLQQALPTTFGYKAAGWLVAVHRARRRLVRDATGLPSQLGGAAGTLALLGDEALNVTRLFAAELDLPEPVLPWHTSRHVTADLGASLAAAAGVAAKIGLDVALLAQTEVGELSEAESGGSSTLPHKHNPMGAVLARACERHARANAAILAESVVQEHERAIGAWHAEWGALTGTLAATAGAVAAIRRSLDGIIVDTGRMRANLDLTGGGIVAERLAFLLEDRERLTAALASGRPLEDGLVGAMAPDELAAALDPAGYLGAAGAFVDRAVALVTGTPA